MSKRPQPTEQDFLDLVEGCLAPERAEVMRAALRADPALARRMQAMVADRAAIRDMSRAAERAAPSDLVADAVSRAERDTLLTSDRAGSSWSFRRIAAVIGLVALLGGALAGSVMMLSPGTDAGADRIAARGPQPQLGSPGGLFEVPSFDEDPRATSAPLPDLTGATSADAPAAPVARRAATRFSSSQEQVARWNQEVTEKLAGEASQPASAAVRRLPDAMVGGMRLSEAARLAVEGRLRITTRPTRADMDALRVQAGASLGAGVGQVVEANSSDAFTVELTTRYDPDLSALQDAIAALAERLANDSFGERAEVRLLPAPRDSAGAAPAIPSFRADDVLWWTRPASTWQQAISVRAPVKVLPVAQ